MQVKKLVQNYRKRPEYTFGKINYKVNSDLKAKKKSIRDTYVNAFTRKADEPCVYPDNKYIGRGIVMCGGGVLYFTCAYINIRLLRHLGCKLPIELWVLGKHEYDNSMVDAVKGYNVEIRDAYPLSKELGTTTLHGWSLKPFAIKYSKFKEVLFLDADSYPVRDPEFLFDSQGYTDNGAVFWPDRAFDGCDKSVWDGVGLEYRAEPEFETGQLLIDKSRCWKALDLALWMNYNSHYFYTVFYGDKETFHYAWRKLGLDYAMPMHRVHELPAGMAPRHHGWVMCQHDFDGNVLFQHRNGKKWRYAGPNPSIVGYRHEKVSRKFLEDLKQLWDGTIRSEPDGSDLEEVKEGIIRAKYFLCPELGNSICEFAEDGTLRISSFESELGWSLLYRTDTVVLRIINNRMVYSDLVRDRKGVWKGYLSSRRKISLTPTPAV